MPASVAKVFGGEVDEARMEELGKYVRPMRDNVVVAPSEDPNTIALGGKELIIPEAAKNPHPTEGVVISTGPDVPLVPSLDAEGLPQKDGAGEELTQPMYMPGDRVVFSRYTGMKMTFGDGAVLLLVPACDIQAIMDPDCPVLGKDKKPDFIPR